MDDELLSAVLEIRQLLRLIAEPQIAQRDRGLRDALRALVGKSAVRTKAIFLMDGHRTRSAIAAESHMDKSDLSKFIKSLRDANLVTEGANPKVALEVPLDFFAQQEPTL